MGRGRFHPYSKSNYRSGQTAKDRAQDRNNRSKFSCKLYMYVNKHSYRITPYRVQNEHSNGLLPSIKRDVVTTVRAKQISKFLENWELITQDAWVLGVVQGFQLPLKQTPRQLRFPPAHQNCDNSLQQK